MKKMQIADFTYKEGNNCMKENSAGESQAHQGVGETLPLLRSILSLSLSCIPPCGTV